jgi:hypothetical protein
MIIPSRIPRLLVVSCVVLTLAVAFCALLAPAFADDDNDPAVLKQRIKELEAKVATLEAQLKDAGVGELSAAEKEKLKQFMDSLPPEDRQAAQTELDKMEPTQRLQIIRRLINTPPGEFLRDKKRAQATRTLEDLRLLDSASDQYAIETNKSTGFHPTMDDLRSYLRKGTKLYNTGADVFGNPYGPFTVDSIPLVPEATFNALSDIADQSFWSPYH